MAPRILIFAMAMGADYLFELISIETYAPQFIGLNIFFLSSVCHFLITIKLWNFNLLPIQPRKDTNLNLKNWIMIVYISLGNDNA